MNNGFQRACARDPVEASILCLPYASSGGNGAVRGMMRNFSSQGGYIETEKQFASGTILMIRTLHCLCPALSMPVRQPRTIGLAEVKWLREIDGHPHHRYGMGVRYLD